MISLGTTKTGVPHPSRAFREGWAAVGSHHENAPSGRARFKRKRIGRIASHPCKKRKGGAASVSKGGPAPVKLPSNLQGLNEVRYTGEKMDSDVTLALLDALEDIQNYELPDRYKEQPETDS